jgi:hypothetical protein
MLRKQIQQQICISRIVLGSTQCSTFLVART